MTAAKNIEKYNEIYFNLFQTLKNRKTPLEIPFGSPKEAQRFRFNCYSFKTALERELRKMSPEEKELDENGYVALVDTCLKYKIKLEGSTLRFVRALFDRNESELAVALALANLPKEENPSFEEEEEVNDSSDAPDLDDLISQLCASKE